MGQLVISIEFELLWVVLDIVGKDIEKYKDNLLSVHENIPWMLNIFKERGISATWATVGAENATSATANATIARFLLLIIPDLLSYIEPFLFFSKRDRPTVDRSKLIPYGVMRIPESTLLANNIIDANSTSDCNCLFERP